MQLDDMQEAWSAQGTDMARNLAIDERLLRKILLRKVRFALAPYLLWRSLEVALGIAGLVAIMTVLADHLAEPRYAVVDGALALFTAGITALWAYLLVNSLNLDYSEPVMAIRRKIECIKLVEYRALKWAVLGGVVAWLPASLVLFETLTGLDALARIDLAWLIANLGFGMAAFAIGQVVSRRFVERPDLGPVARQLVDSFSGRGLRSAAGHLKDLAKFECEDPPAL